MKKYHLADVFTALEVVCGFIIFGMAFFKVGPEIVVFVYGIAELCDAVDGPCARRWHYPNDNKYRWWRVYASQIDQISDILVGIAIGVYLTCCVNFTLGVSALSASTFIGFFIQTLAYDFPPLGLNLLVNYPKLGVGLVLLRRWIYVLALLIVAIILIFATSWLTTVKFMLASLVVFIGIGLLFYKFNRAIQVKTPT